MIAKYAAYSWPSFIAQSSKALSLFVFWTLIVSASNSHAAFNFGGSAQQEPAFLPVDEAFVFDSQITPDGIRLHWKIADDYYLYQSKIELSSIDGKAQLGEPRFSDLGQEEEDPYFGVTRVVHKELTLDLPLSLNEGATDSEISVKYQGCAVAGLCYPPKTQTILFIPPPSSDSNATAQKTAEVASERKTASPNASVAFDSEDASSIFAFMQDSSTLALLGIFFLLGLGLTFTPCVLPMIPIITSIVAGPNGAGFSTSKNFLLSLSYVLGMALTYAALGLAVGLLGAGANLQAAMQSPAVLIFFALIFVVLASAMFGAFELQLPEFLRDRLQNTSNNYSGGTFFSVFIIGALSALLVSPCVSAPLAGALLYISTSGDALLGFSSLLSLGLGMGVPLIIVAVGGVRYLPKTGAWMNASKFLFGILLLSVAIWLIGRLIPSAYSLAMWALLALACSVYMGAFEAANSAAEKLKKTFAIAVFLVAVIWLVGAFSGAGDPFKPLQNLSAPSERGAQTQSNPVEFNKVYSLSELDNALASASKQNKKAFVDIYADWCISCVIMEREVFVQQDVRALLNEFYLIKADVTRNSAENIALLEALGLFGPPSYLLYGSEGNEYQDLRIVGETSKDAFVARLKAALSRS